MKDRYSRHRCLVRKLLLISLCLALVCTGAMAQGAPYTIALKADTGIYSGPGYGYDYAHSIGEDGVFTIVEEKSDLYGNLWGRLKSGAGWVDLTGIRSDAQLPVSAFFADGVDLTGEIRCEYTVEDSEYASRIAFLANQQLRNVELTSLQYDGDAYSVEEVHLWMNTLQKDAYFVADVVFYGDMTAYGLSFVDEKGNEHCYAVSLSGLDGSLVMNEYTP